MARTKHSETFSLQDMVRSLSERVKNQAVRPDIKGYVPHDKQIIFHAASGRHRLYIGGNRSGKTTGGIAEDIWWLTGKHPYRKTPEGGIRGRIVGVDFLNGIEKILKPELMRWCPVSELRDNNWTDSYDTQERTLHFANGSFVEFMSYDQQLNKFAGTSRHFIHFDEEPPQDIYTECLVRLLDTKGSWWMTLTPVEGMEWMYDDIYIKGKTDESANISVIEVETYENPYLDQDEIDTLLAAIGADDQDARIKGKFIRRGGLVYKKFNKMIHVIKPLLEIPSGWEIYASMDHGFNNPTSWHWHGVDSDGNVVTFAEHYASEMVVKDHASAVKAIDASNGRTAGMYIGDPAITQHNGVTGSTVQSEYAINGIYITGANNEVLNGINKVNTYLQHKMPEHPPRWHITNNCTELIREIQRYRWKTWANKQMANQNNKYDVAHKKDDHAMDDVRYFFTIMPDLTPLKIEDTKNPMPVLGPNGIMPAEDKTDPWVLMGSNRIQQEWSTESVDEYMGGEW